MDERPHRIRRALMDPAFRDTFLPDAAKYEKAKNSGKKKGGKKTSSASHGDDKLDDEAAAVVRAFAEANKENALKTRPKVSTPCFLDNGVSVGGQGNIMLTA